MLTWAGPELRTLIQVYTTTPAFSIYPTGRTKYMEVLLLLNSYFAIKMKNCTLMRRYIYLFIMYCSVYIRISWRRNLNLYLAYTVVAVSGRWKFSILSLPGRSGTNSSTADSWQGTPNQEPGIGIRWYPLTALPHSRFMHTVFESDH